MKSLRELELEEKVAQLERRCYQLASKLPIFNRDGVFVGATEPKRFDLHGPMPETFKKIVDGTWDITMHGYEARLIAQGASNRALHYRYVVTERELIDDRALPYIFDREYENFQRCILQTMKGDRK